MKTLTEDYETGKTWNERRAKAEKAGIEKFWQLKEYYWDNKLMKDLGWNEYCNQKKELATKK